MSRFGRNGRVFFVEEPVYDTHRPWLEMRHVAPGIMVATPHLESFQDELLAELLGHMVREQRLSDYVLWLYSPAAVRFTQALMPAAIVYDCIDQPSATRDAAADISALERVLLREADLVFTGAHSLHETRRDKHSQVDFFPDAVDVAHFGAARTMGSADDPTDQCQLPRPRIGYSGVIDERLDLELIAEAARLRPSWQWIFLGPLGKIDPAALPTLKNIHYLGARAYQDVPSYLSGWDVAMMPFVLNEGNRFVSPTAVPEYLAAGLPVVSTPLPEMTRFYGATGLVRIANTARDFVREVTSAAGMDHHSESWRVAVDVTLADLSWDRTWERMRALLVTACKVAAPRRAPVAATTQPVERPAYHEADGITAPAADTSDDPTWAPSGSGDRTELRR